MNSPKFKLVSCTKLPVETIFSVWAQSRPTQFKELFSWLSRKGESVLTADLVKTAVNEGVVSRDELISTFKQILSTDLPISECVSFTWAFSDLPIEWREQAVRKRQWGFWLTSMREFSMDSFFRNGQFSAPKHDAISDEAHESLMDTLRQIELGYRKLIELGAPQEIARKVIPLCATHNGSMFSNFRTLLDTLAARSCWIAHLDLWGSVMESIVSELSDISPLLHSIVTPPCFTRFDENFKGCKYKMINENRCSGKDKYAPCPLYYAHCSGEGPLDLSVNAWADYCRSVGTKDVYVQDAARLILDWTHIWNRNPFTGKIL